MMTRVATLLAVDTEGAAILLIIVGGLVASLIFAAWRVLRGDRRLDRLKRNQCIECGYDLRGSRGDTCPECGARRAIRR